MKLLFQLEKITFYFSSLAFDISSPDVGPYLFTLDL